MKKLNENKIQQPRVSVAAVMMIVLAVVGLSAPRDGRAIIIRHDRVDSQYVVSERDFPAVFFIHYRYQNKVCMGTLISPRWAITAGHCTDQTPLRARVDDGKPYHLTIAGADYTVRDLVVHPDYRHPQQSRAVDLALIKLDRNVSGAAPVDLYQQADELDKVVSFIGWGYTGSGTVGRQHNDGKLRRARNTVVNAGRWLRFRFDDPRSADDRALPLEGIPGLGDSGGPAFFQTASGPQLVGVALGEIDSDGPYTQGKYGTISLYERISSHYSWIEDVLETH